MSSNVPLNPILEKYFLIKKQVEHNKLKEDLYAIFKELRRRGLYVLLCYLEDELDFLKHLGMISEEHSSLIYKLNPDDDVLRVVKCNLNKLANDEDWKFIFNVVEKIASK